MDKYLEDKIAKLQSPNNKTRRAVAETLGRIKKDKNIPFTMDELTALPGIGRKTALRLVLHLLRQDPSAAQGFGEVVLKMRQEIRF